MSIATVTASLNTKWICYSQALLERTVPEWKRIVIDGRKNWSQLGFIGHVIDQNAEYLVHIDEDCFVYDRDHLLLLIDAMRKQNVVAAGTPDGGSYYRQHNPTALNLFFCVFRMDALRDAWRNRHSWPDCKFQLEYRKDVLIQRPELDIKRISWEQGVEPYYQLFWYLLSKGGHFLYLREQLNRSRWSSYVTTERGQAIAEHLWYLRNWFSEELMPGHDCPNRERYENLRNEILAKYKFDAKFLAALARNNIRRYTAR